MKFALALLSHVGYVLLLCLVLVIETETGSQSGHSGLNQGIMWANWMRHQAELSADLNGLEVLLWVWTFSRLLGELREVQWDKVAKDGLLEGLRLYIRDNWNKLDLFNAALVFAVMGMRLYTIYGPSDSEGYSEFGNLVQTFGPRVRLGYALVVLLTFTRTLQFLRYFESIGVLIIILGFMVTDPNPDPGLRPNPNLRGATAAPRPPASRPAPRPASYALRPAPRPASYALLLTRQYPTLTPTPTR